VKRVADTDDVKKVADADGEEDEEVREAGRRMF